MENKSFFGWVRKVYDVIAPSLFILLVLAAMAGLASSVTEGRHNRAMAELRSQYEKAAVEAKAYQRVLEWCLGDKECRIALEGISDGEIRVWGGRIDVDCVDTEHSGKKGLYSLEADYGMYGGIVDYPTITMSDICKYRYEESHATKGMAEEE